MQHLAIQRCIHTPNLEFLAQRILKLCTRLNANSRNWVRGQGHIDWKMDTPNLEFLAQRILKLCTRLNANSRNWVRGQGHIDWKMEWDNPPFQDAFTP